VEPDYTHQRSGKKKGEKEDLSLIKSKCTITGCKLVKYLHGGERGEANSKLTAGLFRHKNQETL